MRRIMSAWLSRLSWRRRQDAGTRHGRRGSIVIIVAVSAIPLATAAGVAVDMSRMAAARSALQRAADNGALSGAAAYVLYTQKDSFNVVASTMAKSAFCNAVTALPAGFVLVATNGSAACVNGQGPAVSAVIAGYSPGSRGTVANSGCTASNTVVAGATCGFVVTVSASATVNTMFPFLLGGLAKVSVTASAINPFVNLATAITPSFTANAANANSIWIYPLLLDANGAPDFSTNNGALPDASACTGNPTQTSCGSYTMLASTLYYSGCPAKHPCNDNGTLFVNGVVQNPVVGTAVITATTPLGVAFQSAAGAGTGGTSYYGYDTKSTPQPTESGCTWPGQGIYNTVSQSYDANGYPLLVDSKGYWTAPTHWFYSSFLANNWPPDYNEITLQQATQTTNPGTGYSYASQIVPAVPQSNMNFNPAATKASVACPDATYPSNSKHPVTTYPTSGATNCALYIVKDPTSLSADPSYVGNSTCFTPNGTPGYQYSALSCQNYAGHNYAFFWNDMSGKAADMKDDTDYNNGTLQIACSGASYVQLIN